MYTMVNLFRKLKRELELRDKMFQDFREMKEKELSELRKINQDLENRLHSLVHPNETISLLDQQRGVSCGLCMGAIILLPALYAMVSNVFMFFYVRIFVCVFSRQRLSYYFG